MEQFSLEKYLENPSHKVVTRRGNPVRIICTDRKHGEDTLPIVFLEESSDGIGEFLLSCRADGTCDNYDTQYDLFFADDEEELTEFEKELEKFRTHILTTSGEKYDKNGECVIKKVSRNLLDLARKELEEDYYLCAKGDSLWEDGYKNGKQDAGEAKVKELIVEFEKGRQSVLKDLPKWKKGTPQSATTLYLIRKGYYMTIKEVDELFEILSKEE